MNIIALTGAAGSGKNQVAKFIREFDLDAVELAFADPLKRIAQDVFQFSDEQLWGPSEMRNLPDGRYIREWTEEVHDGYTMSIPIYLTPRFALQLLGTEWGRKCCPSIWVDYAMRKAQQLFDGTVNPDTGDILVEPASCVIITDCRFANEARAVRRRGGQVWRIVRPDLDNVVDAAGIAGHASEQFDEELAALVSHTLINDSSLEALKKKVAVLLETTR